MEKEFLTFQKFADPGFVAKVEAVLKENDIEYLLEEVTTNFDPSFAKNEITREIRVKLQKDDFARAEAALLKVSNDELDGAGEDNYLQDFTDSELKEVIEKRDEWGQYNFLLAQKILKERGKEMKESEVQQLAKQRLQNLAKPESVSTEWIVRSYIQALFVGSIGIFYGWHILTHKLTLPNGEKVYGYSARDRRHGTRMFIIGIISILVWTTLILWKIARETIG